MRGTEIEVHLRLDSVTIRYPYTQARSVFSSSAFSAYRRDVQINFRQNVWKILIGKCVGSRLKLIIRSASKAHDSEGFCGGLGVGGVCRGGCSDSRRTECRATRSVALSDDHITPPASKRLEFMTDAAGIAPTQLICCVAFFSRYSLPVARPPELSER